MPPYNTYGKGTPTLVLITIFCCQECFEICNYLRTAWLFCKYFIESIASLKSFTIISQYDYSDCVRTYVCMYVLYEYVCG